MAETILRAESITKHYHDGTRELKVLREIDLRVKPGDVIAILGRSGTGKSTLLNIMGLLDRPTSGEIYVNNEPTSRLSERRRTRLRGSTIGFVFQQYHLLDEFSAIENIALGRAVGMGGGLGSANRRRAGELLELVGLADRAGHCPGKLSGGEQQRVAIARALMCDPLVMLCDEPTGNLDPDTAAQVLEVFWRVVRQRNTAMILVTHDQEVARKADRVLRLENGRVVTDRATIQP